MEQTTLICWEEKQQYDLFGKKLGVLKAKLQLMKAWLGVLSNEVLELSEIEIVGAQLV